MIFKANLASRPTRNYSLYFIGCILLAVTAIAFTFYNLRGLLISFQANSALKAKIEQQEKARTEFQRQAAELRTKITAIKTPEFVSETEFLNNAIKRRVFSWTTLFDQLEEVFPENVRMLSVSPSIREDRIVINMEVHGKGLNDVVELIRKLQGSPSFKDIVMKSEKLDADGSLSATITLLYVPEEALPNAQGQKEASKAKVPVEGEKTL